MARPAVDVVVPFRGTAAALDATRARLASLELKADDTLTVVDNGGDAPAADLSAADAAGSYYARNRGAEVGRAEWLVFLDADVTPRPRLLDAYFAPVPADGTGVLAGGIEDEPGDGAALRYAELERSMSHDTVLHRGEWSFAQGGNCAVRREAFEAVGGFCDVRSGGDADLTFRLRAAGWSLEARPDAAVAHRGPDTLPALLRQRARHGSGTAWVESRHPGAGPARRWPGLVLWGARRWGGAVAALARGDRDAALVAAIDPPAVWAFELGRRIPNRAR